MGTSWNNDGGGYKSTQEKKKSKLLKLHRGATDRPVLRQVQSPSLSRRHTSVVYRKTPGEWRGSGKAREKSRFQPETERETCTGMDGDDGGGGLGEGCVWDSAFLMSSHQVALTPPVGSQRSTDLGFLI